LQRVLVLEAEARGVWDGWKAGLCLASRADRGWAAEVGARGGTS